MQAVVREKFNNNKFRYVLSGISKKLFDFVDVYWYLGISDSAAAGLINPEYQDEETFDGRLWKNVGGWYSHWEGYYTLLLGNKPQIYLAPGYEWAASHEFGHALDYQLGYPSDLPGMFKPECALYPYMASNPHEYFACAFDAYFRPGREIEHYYCREDLAESDIDIYKYFEQTFGEFE